MTMRGNGGSFDRKYDRVAKLLADPARLQAARRWAKMRAAEFDWMEIAGNTAEEYIRRIHKRNVSGPLSCSPTPLRGGLA